MTKQVAVLIGSKSQTSFNRLAVQHLQQIAPESIQLNIVEIGDLPLYDRDLDAVEIAEYTQFRAAIKNSDAALWVTPEHNGSYSAMLKNAIDIASRPMGQSLWIGKPLGIVSVNASGSNRAIDALRTVAAGAFINMPVCPFAAAVGGIYAGAFDEQGALVSEQGRATLQGFIHTFADFVAKF